jgi:phage/plasmid-like protein (TIGR03299 family)
MSKYQVNGLPWSSGIGTDVTDCHSAREVMEKAHLDFFVDKCELVAKMPFRIQSSNNVNPKMGDFSYGANIYKRCPNAYCTYRTDTDMPLGLVKQRYEVVQNLDAFNFFDDAIGENKAVWQTAGAFGYGHKIFVSAKLPIKTTVKGDKIDNYLVFSNSHDGSSSINIMFTPIRVFCTNMLNGALHSADTYIRIRHTKTVKERLRTGAEILKIACEYADTAQQLYESLTTIKMSDDDVMKYLTNLVLNEEELRKLLEFDNVRGYRKLLSRDYLTLERTDISTRKANQIVNMFEYYLDGIGQKEIAGTAWGAYNAVTGYYSNVANLTGEKRMESLVYGGANSNMLRALNSAADLRMVV